MYLTPSVCSRATVLAFGLFLGVLQGFPAEPKPLRSLLYYVPLQEARESFARNLDKISILAPQIFVMNAKGEVRGEVEAELLAAARPAGIPTMPLVINEGFRADVLTAVLPDKKKRRGVIDQLLQFAEQNHFAGIQFDFEQVPTESEKEFTKFVEEAARAFHHRKLQFSVAVPAPFAAVKQAAGPPSRRAGSPYPLVPHGYNLKRIGRAADSVTLMAYDGGPLELPLPIAGLRWVEFCLQHVLKQVPAKKLWLGLPFYARHWAGRPLPHLSYREAMVLLEIHHAVEHWNEEEQSPWFEFNEGELHHVVWFENRKSLAGKLRLVRRYRLAGFAGWRLGQEDPAFWEEVAAVREKISAGANLFGHPAMPFGRHTSLMSWPLRRRSREGLHTTP